MKKHLQPYRIVILGAGFGGVHAYLELHKRFHKTNHIDVTVINDGDHFVCTPLIHEVAAGTLPPGGVMEPIRTLPHCCLDRFIDGKVVSVDFDRRTLHVQHNKSQDIVEAHGHTPAHDREQVGYDYLILALGSETNFFDIPGASTYTLELKTLDDAKYLKNRVIESFEKARRINDPTQQQAALTFVVVGGGPTGVEVAGEFADFIESEFAHAFRDIVDRARIVLIERGRKLLKVADPWFGVRAQKMLEQKRHVYLMLDTSVIEVTPDGVQTSNGFVHTHTTVWTAGVRAREISYQHRNNIAREEKTRRIKVARTLNIHAYPEVFVVGDQAWVCDIESHQPYPMRAQFAVREGRVAAGNIARHIQGESLENFHWKDKGLIVSLGKGSALAKVFNVRLTGVFAWCIYRAAYLMALIGWRTRIRTGLEWILNIFLPRDISKL